MRKIIYLEVLIAVIFFVGITITAALAASPPAPDIKQDIANQQKRIDQGIKSGALTKDEAKILQGNLNNIQEEEKRLAADGKLTSEEKVRLNSMLIQNSKMIEDKKNNPVKAVSPQTAVSPEFKVRIANQQKRIDQAAKSGALTKDEAKMLQDDLNNIQAEENRLAADGKLTSEERTRLMNRLIQNNKMLEDKKNKGTRK